MKKITLVDELFSAGRRASVQRTGRGRWRSQIRYAGLVVHTSWHPTHASALADAIARTDRQRVTS
jgi:hypothetical protein